MSDTGKKINLIGQSPSDIATLSGLTGVPAFRSRQLVSWIYTKGAPDFESMSTLPKPLRASLAAKYCLEQLPTLARRFSDDEKTCKYLFELSDGHQVEAVMMRTEKRDTICISTQVGCAYGCRFCATGTMGYLRDLSVFEMISQVMVIQAEFRRTGSEGHFNLVFMGMGEPLANYNALIETITLLNADDGLSVGRRRMTVSTVGLLPQIRKLSREEITVRLALSLNATTNEIRDHFMPINRQYPIQRLLPAMRDYGRITGNRVTLEYVLIDGVNDSPNDARRLGGYGQNYQCKINLIVLNPVKFSDLRPPSDEAVERFFDILLQTAPTATIRYSKGSEIDAGCGQLATRHRDNRHRR